MVECRMEIVLPVDANRDLVAAVTRLAATVVDADGTAPFSEQTLLDLDSDADAVVHAVARDEGRLVGYAQIRDPDAATPSAELAVDPAARRRGVGRALLARVLDRSPRARTWSHGLLPGARALARSAGLTPVRELWQMARPLTPADPFPTDLPAGFAARTFEPADTPAWVALNAAAFAGHPEQGAMTAADVAARAAQPWFDPAGFFLVEDRRAGPGPDGTMPLAAFHWTKVTDDDAASGPAGEVYVVGVAPDRQGLGLGRAVTAIGLAHLRDRGVRRVRLYVEGDNAAAIATYERLGFAQTTVDVMYADPRGDDTMSP